MKAFLRLLVMVLLSAAVNAQDCRLNIGMNLEGIVDWMSSVPFVDVMRQSREWYTQNAVWLPGGENAWNTGCIGQFTFDADGYPLQVPIHVDGAETTQVVRTIWAVLSAWPEGDYSLYYEGQGKLSFNGNLYEKHAEPGKIVLGFNKPAPGEDGMFELGIDESDPSDHIRNIRIFIPGFDTTNSRDYFNPAFLSRLESFGTVRFMDWGRTNNWGHEEAWHCYDEDSDTVRTAWDERALPDDYTFTTSRGVPYEVMIDLCNRTNKDMWICAPHCASDEYIRNLAGLLKNTLKPELNIYVEYSNEIWNWMFGQTQWLYTFYCERMGVDWPEGIVPLIQNCMDIFSDVFADEMHRIVRVVGVQGGWQDVSNRIVFNMRPGSFDAFSPAAYFGLSDEADAALDNLGTSASVDDVAAWTRKCRNEEAMVYLRTQKQEISDRLNIPMMYYEGGQHITPIPFGEEPSYAQALVDIQRDTAMYNLYVEWFDFLETLTKQEQQSLFVNFSFIAERSARYGSWGILEYIDQDTSVIYAPKYSAILNRISRYQASSGVGDGVHESFRLVRQYPNPFNPCTVIRFMMSDPGVAELRVYDIRGKTVGCPIRKTLETGIHTFRFDARQLPSGAYIYVLKAGRHVYTDKMILMR
ncbi:T9SS type A sorting domain-containing protein [bacterium]|nr:T9SS type A sorting domain-containing protein [bacterium]